MASDITGGFIGNLEDAFTPPVAGGCCGSPASTAPDAATSAGTAVSCCGSEAKATQAAEDGCCGQAPAPAAASSAAGTDASAGCCG
ncbi:hypothetical protein FHR32_006336 [Streptosporangium album]|uniref:Uncharacterized protein n=1 Tax=Streptosporangium album TaxID=47479 RepID=A0A7W7S109_9ACTN|nr:hypothetical protein [Streptosporangium album]MBB4941950.1 hypothetical protein [Streptosporangium album]